jgi:hypothetical protein
MSNKEKLAEDDTEADAVPEEKICSLTIEEARRRYDNEEARRTSVESKIGTIITIDALIISLVSVFPSEQILTTVGIILALFSVILGLWASRKREYNRPGKSLGDFLQYRDMPIEKQRKQILFDYIVAVEGNEEADSEAEKVTGNRNKNDKKYWHFHICSLLTGGSLLLLLIVAISSNLGHFL